MEAILIGEFQAIKDYAHTVVTDGRAWGPGFCHRGAAPFKLTVKRVEFLSFSEISGSKAEPTKHP